MELVSPGHDASLGECHGRLHLHLFDNAAELQGLVVLQAACTALGNTAMAGAAWTLMRRAR